MANKDRPHHNARRPPTRTLEEKRQAKREKHPHAPKGRKRRRAQTAAARHGR